MRVLLINYMDILTPGGINTVVRELAKHLAKKGHYVVVFNPSWTKRKLYCKRYGRLVFVKGYGYNHALYGLSIRNALLILRLIQRFNPDIVHLHGFHNLFIPITIILIRLFYPFKLIVFSPHYSPGGHSTLLGRRVFKLYSITVGKLLYELVNTIVCSSLFELKAFTNIVGIANTQKINLIPHGVSYDPSFCEGLVSTLKDRVKSGQEQLKMLYVGYLFEYKGVQDAIKALAILNKELRVDTVLTIVGEGPYKPELIKLAKRLGVEDKIIWKPFIKRDLIKEYCQTDVVVFPSKSEMFGLVAYEALAFGKPVIVAKKAALIECCYKYVNCICVKSAEELAEKIVELSNHPYTSTHPESPPSWNEIVARYLELYSRVCKARK